MASTKQLKAQSDAQLNYSLDKLEKTPAVPGSKIDKARGRQIAAIRAELQERFN